jgi:aminoglycoside phosphotransferase (APT) family kinase protein
MQDWIEAQQRFLTEYFGPVQCVPVTISGTNFIYILEGIDPPRVVKIAGLSPDDVRNEYACLRLLAGRDVVAWGVAPRPYELLEHAGTCILVMERRQGVNLLETILELNKGDWQQALPLYTRLGTWLATLIHSHAFGGADGGIRMARDAMPKAEDMLLDYVPTDLAQTSYALLSSLPQDSAQWVLTHGDYGTHNVLVAADDAPTIFDWEFAA